MIRSLGDGSIILMHDIHEPSVKCATEKLIPALIDQGYKLVTVSELAEAKDVTLQSASYSDFWDSSLQAGRVAGYAGNSSDSEDSSEDGSDGSDSSDGSDVSDGSSDARGLFRWFSTKVIIRMDLPMMEAMMMVPTTNLMTMEAKNIKK